MQLLLDEMLKKTAKWLRIFGINCEFIIGKTDKELVLYAKKNDLILITRDEELADRCKKQNVQYLLLDTEQSIEQLKEIKKSLKIYFRFPEQTRCPDCNNKLRMVEREEVKGIVHENVLRSHEKFWICDICKKVYWQGSHWKNIKKVFEQVC